MFKKSLKIIFALILTFSVMLLDGCFFLFDDNGEDSVKNYFSGVKFIYAASDDDFTDYVISQYTEMSEEILVRLVSAYGLGTTENASDSDIFYLGGVNELVGVGRAISTAMPYEIDILDTHKDAIRKQGFEFAYTFLPADIDDIGFDINSYLFSSYDYQYINDVLYNPLNTTNGYDMTTATGYLDGIQDNYNTNYIQVLTLKILGALTNTVVNEFDTAASVASQIETLAENVTNTGIIGAKVQTICNLILNDVIGTSNVTLDDEIIFDDVFYGYEFDDVNLNASFDIGEATNDLFEFITGTASSALYETGAFSYNEFGEPAYNNEGAYSGLYSVRQSGFKNYKNTVLAIIDYISYGIENGLLRYPQISNIAIQEFTIDELSNVTLDNVYTENMIARKYLGMLIMVKSGVTVNITAISMFVKSVQESVGVLDLNLSLRYCHNNIVKTYNLSDTMSLSNSDDIIFIDETSSTIQDIELFSENEQIILNEFDNSAMESVLAGTLGYNGSNRSDFTFNVFDYPELITEFTLGTSLNGNVVSYYADTNSDYLEIIFEDVSVAEVNDEFLIGAPSFLFD